MQILTLPYITMQPTPAYWKLCHCGILFPTASVCMHINSAKSQYTQRPIDWPCNLTHKHAQKELMMM